MEEIKKVCVLSILDNTNRSKLSAYIMESQTCALNFFKKGVPMKMKVIFYISFQSLRLSEDMKFTEKKKFFAKKVYEQVENTKRSWSEKISVLLFLNVHSS